MSRGVPRPVAALALAGYALLHLPIAALVAFSFNRSRFGVEWTGFTLDWYRRLAEREDIRAALGASLVVGIVSMVISTVLGTLLALGIARLRPRRRDVAEGLLYLPVVTPEIVAGISLLLLFSAIGIPLGLDTIVVAHVAFSVAFVTVVVLARIGTIDPSLEEAAMNLGADELTAFRRAVLPQLWPGILAGALLAFTLSFDDFVITFFVAGVGSTTLPLLVYSMVRRTVEPTINAVSTVILAVTTATIIVADRAAARGRAGAR